MDIACWVTGLRCTEGRTRTDFQEIEELQHAGRWNEAGEALVAAGRVLDLNDLGAEVSQDDPCQRSSAQSCKFDNAYSLQYTGHAFYLLSLL